MCHVNLPVATRVRVLPRCPSGCRCSGVRSVNSRLIAVRCVDAAPQPAVNTGLLLCFDGVEALFEVLADARQVKALELLIAPRLQALLQPTQAVEPRAVRHRHATGQKVAQRPAEVTVLHEVIGHGAQDLISVDRIALAHAAGVMDHINSKIGG